MHVTARSWSCELRTVPGPGRRRSSTSSRAWLGRAEVWAFRVLSGSTHRCVHGAAECVHGSEKACHRRGADKMQTPGCW